MKKTVIIYGSTTGNAASAAETIAAKLGNCDIKDVSTATKDDLENYDNLILGSSTWGDGDLQDDWYGFLPNLKSANLAGKTVAVFGVGDQYSYSTTYVNSMGELYDTANAAGAKIVGGTSTEGYSFDSSTAVRNDKFVGLALDYDNQSDLSDSRIDSWVKQILPEL